MLRTIYERLHPLVKRTVVVSTNAMMAEQGGQRRGHAEQTMVRIVLGNLDLFSCMLRKYTKVA
jgi:hypothetical protein